MKINEKLSFVVYDYNYYSSYNYYYYDYYDYNYSIYYNYSNYVRASTCLTLISFWLGEAAEEFSS